MNEPSRSTDFSEPRGPAAALQRAADMLSLGAAWAAGICILMLTLLVLLDIFLAMLSGFIPSVPTSTGIGWEYSAYLMGSSFLLGSGMTLRAGLQLRVEVLLSAVGARMAHVFETLSAALGAAVTVSLTLWLSWFCYRTYNYGEVSQDSFTPLWIPQLVLAIGAAVLAFQMVARLISCIAGHPLNRTDLGAASAIE
ncbi:TRAP transporter small permease subunit [Roseibium algae]|uniref:TRAP transporter small permease protein n=1 Tax=Roseibium algae TaxID=3123038 RepID=A0ABU8TK00_9HYPH